MPQKDRKRADRGKHRPKRKIFNKCSETKKKTRFRVKSIFFVNRFFFVLIFSWFCFFFLFVRNKRNNLQRKIRDKTRTLMRCSIKKHGISLKLYVYVIVFLKNSPKGKRLFIWAEGPYIHIWKMLFLKEVSFINCLFVERMPRFRDVMIGLIEKMWKIENA